MEIGRLVSTAYTEYIVLGHGIVKDEKSHCRSIFLYFGTRCRY